MYNDSSFCRQTENTFLRLKLFKNLFLAHVREGSKTPLFFQFIFNPADEPLLKHLTDDNQRIEPEWYMPIIPMVLVNGAEGIGTGKASLI